MPLEPSPAPTDPGAALFDDPAAPDPSAHRDEPRGAPSAVAAAAMAAAVDRVASTAPAQSFDAMRDLLISILPDAGDKVRIEDASGRTYEVSPYLPLRREFALKEWFRSLESGDKAAFSAMAGGPGRSTISRALAIPESLIDHLDRAFELCHGAKGEILEQARTAAGDERARPSDLFRGGQLIRGVVPFCVAPLIELLDLAKPAVLLATRSN